MDFFLSKKTLLHASSWYYSASKNDALHQIIIAKVSFLVHDQEFQASTVVSRLTTGRVVFSLTHRSAWILRGQRKQSLLSQFPLKGRPGTLHIPGSGDQRPCPSSLTPQTRAGQNVQKATAVPERLEMKQKGQKGGQVSSKLLVLIWISF